MNLFPSITESILRACPELAPGDLLFSAPPRLDMGDVAVAMFLPARKLKSAPPKLAAELAEKAAFGPEVRKAAAAGPYLNLTLDRSRVGGEIANAALALGDRFGSGGSGQGRTVLIEHTSINPNASPHVGRGRCAMIGDSVTRLFRFEGYGVEVHYYVNDMGRQIGLLVLIADELQNLGFDEILDAYVKANARAEADPDFAERGYGLLVKMEEGDPEAQAKFRAVTDLCLKGQLAVLHRLGATYDVFDHESKYVNDPRLEQVEARLREKGALFTDKEQRLVVDLAPLGHAQEEGRFFVLRRANGSSMYGYRDLAYSLDKNALGADINLMVLGEDHKLYAQQMAMILNAAGHPAPESIYYSYILLKDGKMSTRQGKVVLLADFLDQAAALALERVREQCHDISGDELQAISEQVAVAAIRFAVLRVKPGKNVTFDMESALSFQGDTGPYVQYCCARINSILRRAAAEGLDSAPPDTPFEAEHDAEWSLLLKIAEFPRTVADAVEQRTVAAVAGYALDLAHLFAAFYRDCPVLKAETPARAHSRLVICRAALQALTNALHLLGIAAPERM
ncbi:MAG: arginine--tRNA ligase [Candidatus Hydrogenedentes bacterium]|nr:arginine--tRNA ligase [Candidatus Hydrogenedentota bacterium]